jgi:hypothetical protein
MNKKNLYSYGLEQEIASLFSFFDFHAINYDRLNKEAYPNDNAVMYTPTNYNLEKWVATVKKLYTQEKQNGISRREAIKSVTQEWNPTETFDFLNWMRYYEEGNQLKYKTAQWYENGSPGYFLHLKKDPPAPQLKSDHHSIENVQEDLAQKAQKKQTIEAQRSKIIGRLDSAEKLLRSQEGQLFAGNELEDLMESIYSLKKKIQLVNKISSSVRLYEDMIVRESNVLRRRGLVKSAEFLYKTADPDLNATPPPSPTTPEGAPGGLPATIPGVPNVQTSSFNDQNKDQPPVSAFKAPPPEVQDKPKSKGIEEFLVQMDTAGDTDPKDLEAADDVLEVEDDVLMVSEAQVVPPPPASPTVAPPATEKPLEVSEDDVPTDEQAEAAKGNAVDEKIDAALANITIDDVVAKLEDLSKIFKVREIPRQLALIDIMMQQLGIASYFSNLSEAQNKALDSNNYISTRVDDMLAKLRGASAGGDVDLTGGQQEDNPAVQSVKNNLQLDADKEKARKENRKKQENEEADLATKETPNVEIDEDLDGKPAAPPPAPTPLPPTV